MSGIMDTHMMRRGSDKVRYNGDSGNFVRGSRARVSMPITRPNNQSRERPMGVLFLQVGNNTRQAVMPNVVTSLDTVRALFVRTFPERLSMAALNSPDARLYILDEGMDAFRPLDSHWDIVDQSVLKLCFRSSSHAVLGSSTQKRDFPYSGELVDDMLWQNAPGYRTLFSKDSTFSHQNKMFPSSHNSNADWSGGEVSSPVSPGLSATIVPPGGILERRDVRPNDDFLQRAGKPSRHQSSSWMNPPVPGPVDYRAPTRSVWENTATTSRHGWVDTQGKRAGERTWRGPPNVAFDTTDSDGTNLQHGLQQMAMTLSRWMQGRERDRAVMDWEMAERRGDVGRSSFSSRSSMASNNETRNRMESLERQIGGLTDMLRNVVAHGGLESCPEKQSTRSYFYPEERQNRRTRPGACGAASDILHVPRAERAARPRQRFALFQLQEGIQHLRTELGNLRHMQVKQQQACAMMIHAGKHDLSVAVSSLMSRMARTDASRKERLQAENQRQRYAARAQTLSWQLSELEQAMRTKDGQMGENEEEHDAELQRKRRDLEHVHQVLGQLHDQYQNLQPRLCTLLRAEVEAMKFLKDEPHRLESLVKRTANVEDTLDRFHGTRGFKESNERNKECSGEKEVSDIEQEERSINKYKKDVQTCRQPKERTQNGSGTEHGGRSLGAVCTKMSDENRGQKSSDDEDFISLTLRTVPETDSVQMVEGEMKDDETETIIASDEDHSAENEAEDTSSFSSRSDSGKERPSSFADVMDQDSISDASKVIEIIDEHSAGDDAESNAARKRSAEYAQKSIDGHASDAVSKSTVVLDADMASTVSTSSATRSSPLPVECSFSPKHSPPQSHSPLHNSLSLSPSQSLHSLQSSSNPADTCFSSTQPSVLSDPDTSSNANSSRFLPAASLEYSETVNVLHSVEPFETTSSTNLISTEPFTLNARSSSPDGDVLQPVTSNQTSAVDIEPTLLYYKPHLDLSYSKLTESLPLMEKQTTATTTHLRILPLGFDAPPPPTAEPPPLPGPPPASLPCAIIKRSVLPPKRFVLPSKSFTARSLPNRAFSGLPPPPSRAPPPPSLPPPPPPPQTKLPEIPHYSSLHHKTEKSKPEQEPLFKGERELVPPIHSPLVMKDGCEDVEKVAEQTKEQRQTKEEEEEMEEKLSDSLKHSDSLSSISSDDSLSSTESSPASRDWESLEDLNLESPYTVTKLAEPDRPQKLLEDVEPELGRECSEEKMGKLSASCDFSESYGEKTCVDNDDNKSAEQQPKRTSDRRRITVRYIEEISPLATKGEDSYCEQETEKEKLAFVIGEHRVQAMSHDEASRLVSEDNTLTKNMAAPAEMGQVEDGDGEPKEESKQIVVFFEEPMDIRQAYKRLSTIFEDGEFEEDLRKMENDGNSFQNDDFIKRFEQQNELTMNQEEVSCVEDANFVTEEVGDETEGGGVNYALNEMRLLQEMQPASADRKTSAKETSSSEHPRTSNMESQRQVPHSGAEDHGGKSKFKIRFPRKQLVALTSALRSGSRSGKKTLDLLVEGSGGHGRQTKVVPRSPYEDQINPPTVDGQRNTRFNDGSELPTESGSEIDIMASAEGCLHNETFSTCRKGLVLPAMPQRSEDEDLKNGQSSSSDPESASTQGHKGLRMLQNLTSSMWNTETRKRKA